MPGPGFWASTASRRSGRRLGASSGSRGSTRSACPASSTSTSTGESSRGRRWSRPPTPWTRSRSGMASRKPSASSSTRPGSPSPGGCASATDGRSSTTAWTSTRASARTVRRPRRTRPASSPRATSSWRLRRRSSSGSARRVPTSCVCRTRPTSARFSHLPPRETSPLARLPRPVVGYYGAIAEWFDAEAVALAAARRRGASFVLIGRESGADLVGRSLPPAQRAPPRRGALREPARAPRGVRRVHDPVPPDAADRGDQPGQALRVLRHRKADRGAAAARDRAVRGSRGRRALRHAGAVRRGARARADAPAGRGGGWPRGDGRSPARTRGRSATARSASGWTRCRRRPRSPRALSRRERGVAPLGAAVARARQGDPAPLRHRRGAAGGDRVPARPRSRRATGSWRRPTRRCAARSRASRRSTTASRPSRSCAAGTSRRRSRSCGAGTRRAWGACAGAPSGRRTPSPRRATRWAARPLRARRSSRSAAR